MTLNGRHDVALAAPPSPSTMEIAGLWVSPAKRARATAAGLFPDQPQKVDARLWEQDFGQWDGLPFAELPDVGTLSKDALADLKAEGGENFHDMARRAEPALREAARLAMAAPLPIAVVAHAGIVRVALAMAMGDAAAALAFQISYEGATRLTCSQGGMAITAVNATLP